MKLTLIWAMAKNRVIGKDGGLPWHLPDDLRHFKETTRGHAVIIGRKTFESVGKPLPGRTNIVVTRNPEYRVDGAIVVHDFDAALAAVPAGEHEAFCVGGADLYRLALPRADRLVVTVVDAEPEGGVRFPELDLADWKLASEAEHGADSRHAHAFTIRTYERA